MLENQEFQDTSVPPEFMAIIRALSDGCFHSGEELGQLLGVSRAAVWKRLQQLQALLGLHFESVRGLGYRLSGGIELLSAERVKAALPAPASTWLKALEIHNSIDSTNRHLARRGQGDTRPGVVVVAEYQSAGSGRRGRSWVSPFGRNLYFSTVWSFEGGIAALEGLSLVIGLVLARIIEPLTDRSVQLKWPNDVLVDGRKIAGILLEVVGDPDGRCSVIIGVGINVNMTGVGAAEQITQAWCDVVSVAKGAISRNELLAALLAELVSTLTLFERVGFSAFREEWARFDYLKNQPVTVEGGGGFQSGVALGVDGAGALILDINGERHFMHGGEVSVRLKS